MNLSLGRKLLADLAYRPSGVLSSGFTDQVPTKNQVVSGQHRHKLLGRNASNLVAQSNLGVMYSIGQGVIQDNVYAHMWGNLG